MIDKLRHLYNEWYIGNDAYNIILYERKINTRGKNVGLERFSPTAYFSNIKQLQKSLLNKYVVDNIVNIEMDTLFNRLEEIVEFIDTYREYDD